MPGSPVDDWDSHWDQYAESAASNPAQSLRRKTIRSMLSLGDQPARVLDIGCGQGDLIAELRAAYPAVELCGIDYSNAGIQVARRKVPGVTFVRRDLTEPGQPAPELRHWASHAVCSEVLEHVDDPRTLLQNAAAYLAPGCRLVVTVPGGPMSAFDHHIGHRTHFSVEGLQRLLTDSGFAGVRAFGAGFPFFNLYRLVVIQRGPKLVSEVAGAGTVQMSPLARATMKVFSGLFRLSVPTSRWGWQIVGVATLGDRC
jgi:SAM-dependent methyltransferase